MNHSFLGRTVFLIFAKMPLETNKSILTCSFLRLIREIISGMRTARAFLRILLKRPRAENAVVHSMARIIRLTERKRVISLESKSSKRLDWFNVVYLLLKFWRDSRYLTVSEGG